MTPDGTWYSRALDGDPQDAEIAAYLAELTEPLVVTGPGDVAFGAPAASVGAPAAASMDEPRAPVVAEPAAATDAQDSHAAQQSEASVGDGLVDLEMTVEPQSLDESPYRDESGFAESAAEAAPPAAAAVEGSAEESAPPAEVASEPDDRAFRSTPASEGPPIVTRTLAELYLQQGYLEPALEIYRQLSEREPEDATLRAKVAELTGAEEAAPSAPAGVDAEEPEAGRVEAAATPLTDADVESQTPAEEARDEGDFDFEIGPMTPGEAGLMEEAAGAGENLDEATADAGTRESSTELWDTADSWGAEMFAEAGDTDEIFGLAAIMDQVPADAAPAEAAPSEPAAAEPTEAPGVKTPAVDVPTEETTVASEYSTPAAAERRGITVRDFFATLGSARPPTAETLEEPEEFVSSDLADDEAESAAAAQIADGATYPYADDAFANLFEDSPVSPEDNRAAAALSGAVAHPPPVSTPATKGAAPPARDTEKTPLPEKAPRESEEDIRRFREWLEGLANS